jgi:hypothetical protein
LPELLRLELGPNDRSQWFHLTPPLFRSCLEGKDYQQLHGVKIIAIGAKINDEPSALLIASFHPDIHLCEVHSIQASEAHDALLAPLVSKFEEELQREGGTSATFTCPIDSHFPKIATALKTWSGPRPFIEKYIFDIYTFSPPWFERLNSYPENYEEFLWKKISSWELDKIAHWEEECRFPISVSPLDVDGQTFCPINSLGLRHDGELAGWCITHKLARELVRYSALYIAPELKIFGPSITLLSNSIRRQKKSKARWSCFELNLIEAKSSWIAFVRKKLAPFAIERVDWVQFWVNVHKSTSN